MRQEEREPRIHMFPKVNFDIRDLIEVIDYMNDILMCNCHEWHIWKENRWCFYVKLREKEKRLLGIN